MTGYKPGDVVLVPFPFTDLKRTKKRPALVLAWIPSQFLPSLAVVCMITSQVESGLVPGDYSLQGWRDAGLIHPSKIRLSKIVSLEDALILKKMGTLKSVDRKNIQDEFQKLFHAWI